MGNKSTAAAKTAPAKTTTKVALAVDPRASDAAGAAPNTAPPDQVKKDQEAATPRKRAALDEMVTVIVPKPFKLTDDKHGTKHYDVGIQEMTRSDATHWFAVANGVEIKE